MNFNTVKAAITSKTGRQMLVLKKNSPTLLFAAGVGGVITATVVACRATIKAQEITKKVDEDIDVFKSIERTNDAYSAEDLRKDVALYYFREVGLKVAKLYAPAVIIGTASIGCLYGSHRILNSRNAGLMAAYAALDQTYREYRERVTAELGDDRERALRADTKSAVQAKNGELAERIGQASPGSSAYARLFSEETSKQFNKQPEYNIFFLKAQQNYLNDRLRAVGHVFLNEAYDALGLERTKAGALTGWIWDGPGDNYIDFGIWDSREKMDQFYEFATGKEGGIWLDFNVDGVIYDKI